MIGTFLKDGGLFLAAFAAFTLAAGHPHVACAAGDPHPQSVEELLQTEEGKAAIERAGYSPEAFKALLDKLSPEQRRALDEKVRNASPRTRLAARLVAAGYTRAEAEERLARLTDEEIVRLANDPDATTAGAGTGAAVAIAVLVLAVVLVAVYFLFIEEPTAEPPPAPPAGK
jgi:hypothetical protein